MWDPHVNETTIFFLIPRHFGGDRMQTDKMLTKKIDVSLICRFHVFLLLFCLLSHVSISSPKIVFNTVLGLCLSRFSVFVM